MDAELYLNLTIGGTGGAGTEGDPYRSFADVPTYTGGADRNILVIGDSTISGTQTIKGGYNYFARSLQEISSTTSEGVFGVDNVAYDTTFNTLAFNGRWNDTNDNLNLITATDCRFRRSMVATSRFFYIHRSFSMKFCWISGACTSPGNNQSIFLQASLGNNGPFPVFTMDRCSMYLKASGIDGSETIFTGAYFTSKFLNGIAQIIDVNGQVSASTTGTLSTGSYSSNDDVILGTNLNEDIGFIDPENHNLELIDSSKVLTL